MLINDKTLQEIQGNGFAIKNKFPEKEVKFFIKKAQSVGYLFAFVKSVLIFRNLKHLEIELFTDEICRVLNINHTEFIESIKEVFVLLSPIFSFKAEFKTDKNLLIVKPNID